MRHHAGIGLILALAMGVGAVRSGQNEIQGGYSTKPLERPVFELAKVVVDATVFNNWLSANYGKLDSESMKGPREHLYYLIDSYVKAIWARDGVVLPESDDLVLASLFSWSERLGVFGGHLVYNAVRSDGRPEQPELMRVPDEFDLVLRGDTFLLSSEDWSVSIPYYFMIWNLQQFDAKDGPTTQLVLLSTGAARHEGQEGHSQATLMFLFGPGAEEADFTRYWVSRFGYTGSESGAESAPGAKTTYKRFDEERNMRLEFASWSSPQGAYVVIYSGIEGTYQWNRPHFLDFLGAIHEREP